MLVVNDLSAQIIQSKFVTGKCKKMEKIIWLEGKYTYENFTIAEAYADYSLLHEFSELLPRSIDSEFNVKLELLTKAINL